MRFTDIDINFDLTYDDHQKIIKMSIESIFDQFWWPSYVNVSPIFQEWISTVLNYWKLQMQPCAETTVMEKWSVLRK